MKSNQGQVGPKTTEETLRQYRGNAIIKASTHPHNTNPHTTSSSTQFEKLKIILITLLGGGLRLFHLGNSSFWFDETGVAEVVYSNSLNSFVSLVRSHVMAVPLDYAITWLVGQKCNTETCLRTPSAIWGTLTLLVAYFLCRALFDSRVAIRAMLIIALSPLLIQYSQELRFYSSLGFFYLLSSYLLLKALQSNRTRMWLLAVASITIGIFFHIFTAFALVNGWIWAFFKFYEDRRNRAHLLRKMILVSLAALATLLLAYVTFLGYTSASLSHHILDFDSSLLHLFGIAFGWIPYLGYNVPLSWLWGVICFGLEFIGITVLITKYPRSNTAGLFYSVILQISAIFCANLTKHYAIAPRQFIAMLPIGLMLVAFGSTIVHDWIIAKLPADLQLKNKQQHPFITGWTFLIVFLLASLPVLSQYYSTPKSYDREIAQYLAENWREGDHIFFTSMMTAQPINYYLVERMQREDIAPCLFTIDEQNLSTMFDWDNEIFLVSSKDFSEPNINQLRDAGFLQIPPTTFPENITIWFRGAPK